jgi:cytochrome P450
MAELKYDPRDPEVMNDPLPLLKRLQDEDPAHWSDALGGWVVTRHEDVRRVQSGTEVSADRLTPFFESLPGPERERLREVIHYLNTWVAFKDPPEHMRLRTILNAVFQPRDVEAFRPRIEQAVDELLDRLDGVSEFDFIQAFAFPLPATVILFMCGLPPQDMDRLKRWSELMKPFIGSASRSPEKYEQAREGVRGMADYFRDVVRERARKPGTDVISRLVARDVARHDGSGQVPAQGSLTEDEIVGTCMLFLFGGHETTTNLLGNGMRCLIRFPDERERLLADPQLVKPAVEEILRFDGPTGGLVRVVKVEHEFHNRTFKPGDRVFSMVHAANHDRRRFPVPERFDIGRTPNPHLTFNYAPHFCLGAPLARLEGHVAFERLVRRFPRLELAGPVSYMDTLVMRGVREMRVRVGS